MDGGYVGSFDGDSVGCGVGLIVGLDDGENVTPGSVGDCVVGE